MEYPRYKHHRTMEPRIVKSEEEEAALGPEWADFPYAPPAKPKPARAAGAAAEASGPPTHPKWKHHLDGRSIVVKNAEEEEALGEGWGDFPTSVAPKPVKASTAPAAPTFEEAAMRAKFDTAWNDLTAKHKALQEEHGALVADHEVLTEKHEALGVNYDALGTQHEALKAAYQTVTAERDAAIEAAKRKPAPEPAKSSK